MARDLSYYVDLAHSAAEYVATKVNIIMAPKQNAGVVCVDELLASGKLERRTPLYFFACTLLVRKKYRDMLDVMQDTDEKF